MALSCFRFDNLPHSMIFASIFSAESQVSTCPRVKIKKFSQKTPGIGCFSSLPHFRIFAGSTSPSTLLTSRKVVRRVARSFGRSSDQNLSYLRPSSAASFTSFLISLSFVIIIVEFVVKGRNPLAILLTINYVLSTKFNTFLCS